MKVQLLEFLIRFSTDLHDNPLIEPKGVLDKQYFYLQLKNKNQEKLIAKIRLSVHLKDKSTHVAPTTHQVFQKKFLKHFL